MPAYDLRIRPHIKAEPTLEPVDDMPIEYMDEDEKKLTKRQRLLVWNAVNDPTLTFSEAARKAGYKNPIVVGREMRPNGKYQHVRRVYERLMGEAKKKFELTFDKAVEDLYKLRDAAWEKENFTAAINAQNLLLKMGGLIVDRREVLHGKIDQMSREDVEKRLQQLLGSRALENNQSGRVIEDKSGGRLTVDDLLESGSREKVGKKKEED